MPFIYSSVPAGNPTVDDIKRARQEAARWARIDPVIRPDSTHRSMEGFAVSQKDERARKYTPELPCNLDAAPSTAVAFGAEAYDRTFGSRAAVENWEYTAINPYSIVYAEPHEVPQITARPAHVQPPPGFPNRPTTQTSDRIFAFSPSVAYAPAPTQMPVYAGYAPQVPAYSPHNTYSYPQTKAEPVYEEPHTTEAINDSFARWYVDEVISYLVKPGQYRAGTGGQSEEVWGESGRIKDSYDRVGVSFADSTIDPTPRGHMDMAIGRTVRNFNQSQLPYGASRQPQYELYDPYRVSRETGRPEYLVSFIVEILGRMAISPTAVVNAVWFLRGLGLHQGDGPKGLKLRNLLYEQQYEDREAVAKRVAMLGLILSGKWLDDNSFLTKSWHEVTQLPISTINKLERYALEEYQYSLFVPLCDWADHVCLALAELNQHYMFDALDAVVACHLDRMALDAREAEIYTGASQAVHADLVRRLSVVDSPAADQAIQREWDQYAQNYSIAVEAEPKRHSSAEPLFDNSLDDITSDIEAERNVAALVDDEWMDGNDEEDEYDFIEYDGAKPWLPTASQSRRSHSNSSTMSYESMQQWRSATHHANSSVTDVEHVISEPVTQVGPEATTQSLDRSDCVECRFYAGPQNVPGPRPLESFDLEPGISIVMSPNTSNARRETFTAAHSARRYGLDIKVDPTRGSGPADVGSHPQIHTSHNHKNGRYTGWDLPHIWGF